jgi:hypothetical protein
VRAPEFLGVAFNRGCVVNFLHVRSLAERRIIASNMLADPV